MTVAAPTALYLNGQDAARLGFVFERSTGLTDSVRRTDATVDWPQTLGAYQPNIDGRVASRTLTLEGVVTATSRTGLELAKDRLKALCYDGVCEIRLVAVDRVWYGRLGGITLTQFDPQLRDARTAARAVLQFVCADPLGWDRTTQLVAFGATPVALPLGTAPSRGRAPRGALITIHGPATTPTLREHDAAGTVVRSMGFSFSPTANDALEIDVARGLVTRLQSGARDNGLPFVSAGFEFPRLSPADGDHSSSAFPQLSVTTGVGMARYCRSWL